MAKQNKLPTGCFELVYNSSNIKTTETPDTVPTTIPKQKWDELSKLNGDKEPYFLIEAINIPANGTGGVYDMSFFKSFNKRIASSPLPGDKFGHEYISRQPTDFFTVGSKIGKDSDGNDTEFLKIFIPDQGFTTDNFGLIRDAKIGIVNFSLVTWPEYKMVHDNDTDTDVRHFTATKGYERNDAVGYGEGAMAQTVNKKDTEDNEDDEGTEENGSVSIIQSSVKNARSLINSGKVDKTSKWTFSTSDEDALLGSEGDDWSNYKKWHMAQDTSQSEQTKGRYKYPYGKNGKVYRSALRAIASRAAAQGLSDLSDTASSLLSLLDKSSKKNGGRYMDDDEVFQTIRNMLENNSKSYKEIAANCGMDKYLRNEADSKNADFVKECNSIFGEGVAIDTLKKMKKENEDNAKLLVENSVIQRFGAAKIKDNKGKELGDNPAYVRGMELCRDKRGDELTAALDNAAKDPLMKLALGSIADNNSAVNVIRTNKNEVTPDGGMKLL